MSKKIAIYCILILVIAGCHPFDNQSIHLLNKSNIRITEYHEFKLLTDTAFSCPDCTITDSIMPLHKEQLFVDRVVSVKSYLKDNPDKRLMVYVLNADTCLKYQKQPEVLKGKVLKLFILSENDILKDSTVISFNHD